MSVAQLCLTLCDPIGCSLPGPVMEFSRQENCSGLPFPSPGDLPDPGMERRFSAMQADSLSSAPPGKTLICILTNSYMEYGVKILQSTSNTTRTHTHTEGHKPFVAKACWCAVRNVAWGFPGGAVGKNLSANAGDMGSQAGKIPHASEQVRPVPQLLSSHAATEVRAPRACAPWQTPRHEKPEHHSKRVASCLPQKQCSAAKNE